MSKPSILPGSTRLEIHAGQRLGDLGEVIIGIVPFGASDDEIARAVGIVLNPASARVVAANILDAADAADTHRKKGS